MAVVQRWLDIHFSDMNLELKALEFYNSLLKRFNLIIGILIYGWFYFCVEIIYWLRNCRCRCFHGSSLLFLLCNHGLTNNQSNCEANHSSDIWRTFQWVGSKIRCFCVSKKYLHILIIIKQNYLFIYEILKKKKKNWK